MSHVAVVGRDARRDAVRAIPDGVWHDFRRMTYCRARRMQVYFDVKTAPNRIEHGKPGDYLVEYYGGDAGILSDIISADEFERSWEPCEPPNS